MLPLYSSEHVLVSAALLVAALAVFTDLKWRLIPNRLTLPAIIGGLILNLALGGWQGLLLSVLGVVVGVGFFILPFAIGKMGGGDVKLMGALGAILGAHAIISVAIYSALAGGVLAMAVALAHSRFLELYKRVWLLLKRMFLRTSPQTGTLLQKSSLSIPYGVAIATGTLLYVIIGKIV